MNYILDSSNAAIASVTFMGSTLAGPGGNVSFDGLPLGLVNGELALKIMGTGGGGGIPSTDNGAAWTQKRGVAGNIYSNNTITAGNVTDAPASGKCLVLDDLVINVEAALRLVLTEGADGNTLFVLNFAAPCSQQITTRGKLKLPANTRLSAISDTAAAVSIQALYHEEAP